MTNKIICGVTILRNEYYDTFGEAFDGSDDDVLSILEVFPQILPVRYLNSRERMSLVAIMRADWTMLKSIGSN